MATVRDVAAAIIEDVKPVDHMKLQKLIFYVQGWSLAWTGAPMFTERVEAWRWGPMVDVTWQDYKSYGHDLIESPKSGDSAALTVNERGVLSAVLNRYGNLSALELANMTHENAAWQDAWGDRGDTDRGRQRMDTELIVQSLRTGSFGHPDQAPTVEMDETLLARARSGDADALSELLVG